MAVINPTPEQVLFIKTILHAIHDEPKLRDFINKKTTGKTTALKMIDEQLNNHTNKFKKP